MPSYADSGLSPDDAWHLAYYVASLHRPPQWNMILHPMRIEGALPMSTDDSRWAAAEHTDVQLRNVVNANGEWAAPPTVRAVGFEAVYNETDIAIRLTWDDPTQETSGPSADGIAVALKPEGFQGDLVTLQAWPYQGAPMLDLCYWSADPGAAVESLAADFERAQSHHAPQEPLESRAKYDDGRWQLVLHRKLSRFSSLAVAVWDGGNPETRAVSYWVDMNIKKEIKR